MGLGTEWTGLNAPRTESDARGGIGEVGGAATAHPHGQPLGSESVTERISALPGRDPRKQNRSRKPQGRNSVECRSIG